MSRRRKIGLVEAALERVGERVAIRCQVGIESFLPLPSGEVDVSPRASGEGARFETECRRPHPRRSRRVLSRRER